MVSRTRRARASQSRTSPACLQPTMVDRSERISRSTPAFARAEIDIIDTLRRLGMRLTAFTTAVTASRDDTVIPAVQFICRLPARTNLPSAARSRSLTSHEPTPATRRSEGICLAAHHADAESAMGSQALVKWLESSQWLTGDELERNAFRQLAITARHCERESPFFAERLKKAGTDCERPRAARGLVGSSADDTPADTRRRRRSLLPQRS